MHIVKLLQSYIRNFVRDSDGFIENSLNFQEKLKMFVCFDCFFQIDLRTSTLLLKKHLKPNNKRMNKMLE